MYKTTVVEFANSAVGIEFCGDRAAAVVEFVTRHLAQTHEHEPYMQLRLISDSVGCFELYSGRNLVYQGYEAAEVTENLLGRLWYHLANTSHGGLLFHAAVVSWHGNAIMFPGISGAGKSTLTAWLLTQNFAYSTDEMAFLPATSDSAILESLVRPFNLKSTSRSVIGHHVSELHRRDDVLSATHVDIIQPTVFSKLMPVARTHLRVIVFPTFQAGREFEWTRLSPGQAGLELMQSVINARNLPKHGFDYITALVKKVPSYKMFYSHFDQVQQKFEELQNELAES